MKRNLLGLALLTLTALVTGCAKEPDARWRHVANDIYLDPASIKVRAGHTSAWFDFRKMPSMIFFWASPKHRLSLEAIDCAEGRMATMASRRRFTGGYYEEDEDPQKLKFEYVTPDTVAEAMLDAVCKTQAKVDTQPANLKLCL